MKVAVKRLMFGPLLIIRQFPNFIKLFDNLRKVLLTDIYNGIPCLFVLLHPYFGVEIQSGNQPFPDLSNFTFNYEDLFFILFRLSNFDEMSKVTDL